MNKPNAATKPFFLCIGAQKAGTSWLYSNLRRHPQIVMPPVKELHFFDDIELDRGRIFSRWNSKRAIDRGSRRRLKRAVAHHVLLRPSRDDRWALRFHMIRRDETGIPAYARLLTENVPEGSIAGDITPAYATLDKPTIEMIRRVIPHAKILFLLRDPIEREWSAAKMSLLRFKGKDETEFDEAEFTRFLAKDIQRTDYLRTIENWLHSFSRDQFGVFFYDDLASNPLAFLNRILDFLGVAPVDAIPQRERANKGLQLELPANLRAALLKKHEAQIRGLVERLQGDAARYPLEWLVRHQATTITS